MRFQYVDNISDLGKYISLAFEDDYELMSKYHIKEGSFEDCVIDTYLKIEETGKEYELLPYVVSIEDGKGEIIPIGYCVILYQYDLLYSFGINKKYRKEYSDLFFQTIQELFDNQPFKCMLWSKNTRAINFLTRNGMQIDFQTPEITSLCL